MKPKSTANSEFLTLNTLHQHLSNILGWNAGVLVTSAMDGGIMVTPLSKIPCLAAAPAATVYPFTKEDETFLRSLKIHLEPV